MEDPIGLREQAARSRRLANSTHDRTLRNLLLSLADEFAASAAAAEAETHAEPNTPVKLAA